MNNLFRTIKSVAYNEASNLVRNATRNSEKPADDDLIWKVIKLAGSDSNSFASISSMLWERINDKRYSQHVYKGLLLLYHLLVHGKSKVEFRRSAALRMDDLKTILNSDDFLIDGAIYNDIRKITYFITKMLEKDKYPPDNDYLSLFFEESDVVEHKERSVLKGALAVIEGAVLVRDMEKYVSDLDNIHQISTDIDKEPEK